MEFNGEEILRLKGLERVQRYEEMAAEYSIRSVPQADSGIVVYGLFSYGWVANPNLRPIVRELCARLGLLPDRCEHGILDGNYCETCNRSYKQAQSDPDNE